MRNTRPSAPSPLVRARGCGTSRIGSATTGIAVAGGAATLIIAAGLAMTRSDASTPTTVPTPARNPVRSGAVIPASAPTSGPLPANGPSRGPARVVPQPQRQTHHAVSQGS